MFMKIWRLHFHGLCQTQAEASAMIFVEDGHTTAMIGQD
jgi:hypothetical protein